MKKGALLSAGVSDVHPLRRLPNGLSLQVVRVRQMGSFAEVFPDYTRISEDLNTQQVMSLYKTNIEGRSALVFVHKQS